MKNEINIEGLEKKDIRGNAVLTVANFKIKVNQTINTALKIIIHCKQQVLFLVLIAKINLIVIL